MAKTKTKEWTVTLPFSPVATPRPDFHYIPQLKKSTAYYPKFYTDYLKNIDHFLTEEDLRTDDFHRLLDANGGVIATMTFFCAPPANQKKIPILTKKTRPDVDNLVKAVLDGIFNSIKEDDGRVISVTGTKVFAIDGKPRTEVSLKPFEIEMIGGISRG